MNLRINKETLRNLSQDEQDQVAGAMPPTMGGGAAGCSALFCWTDAGPRCSTNSIARGGKVCCA